MCVCVCVSVCLSVNIFLSILVIYLLWSEICYSCIRLPFFLPWPPSYLPRPPSFPTFLRRLASFLPPFLPFLDSFLPSFFGLLSYLPSFLHFFLGFLPCVSFFLGFHPWLPSLASFLLLEITFYLNFMTTSLIKSLNSVSTDLMIIIFHLLSSCFPSSYISSSTYLLPLGGKRCSGLNVATSFAIQTGSYMHRVLE